jgi:hypothetical protein
MSKSTEIHVPSIRDDQGSQKLNDERIQERIRLRAYQLYEARGAAPGHEVEDWTAAEKELLGPMHVAQAA